MTVPRTDRSSPPPAEAPSRFRFPSFRTRAFDNGLRAFVCHYDRGPLIQVSMVMSGGAGRDSIEVAGRTTLAASLLDEGTSGQTSMELAARAEILGGYLSTQADWDSMSASVGVLSENQQQGFQLLTEVVTDAVLPEAEVERLRAQRLAEIQRRRARPGVLASDALARVIYGKTPYAAPLLGTGETIRSVSRNDLTHSVRSHATPITSSIVAVGDLDPEEFFDRIEANFGSWKVPSPDPVPEIAAPPLEGRDICMIDRPESPQTELRLGHAGLPRTDPDYLPLQVLNSLLGGKFTSRINLKLREELGITYGASSGFANRAGPGPFVVSASVDTDSVGLAVEEILTELDRLQREPVEAAELEETKSYLLGVFPYTLQRIEGMANRIAEIALYELPLDYYQRSLERIRTVDADQILQLARMYLQPERLGIAVVGPVSVLRPQLEPLGKLIEQPEPDV